jgi:hypothetical protein
MLLKNNSKLKEYILTNFMNVSSDNMNNNTNIIINDELPIITERELETVPETKNILYKYLDDNILSKEFSNERDYSKDYNLKFCLFSINKSLQLPFIEYYLINKNNILDFPEVVLLKDLFTEINNQIQMKKQNTSFINSIFNSVNIDDINHNIENIFLEQIIEVFKQITKLSYENGLDAYRGFIDNNDDIYVFFDCTEHYLYYNNLTQLYSKTNNKNPFIKCLMQDISNKTVLNYPIKDSILNIFYEYPFLMKLKDENNELVNTPKSVYLCENVNSYYTNVIKIDNDEVSLLHNKIYHEEFDFIYVFSETPLDSNNNIKRFVMYYDNIPIKEEKEEKEEIFYFYYNQLKLIGVEEDYLFIEL